MKTILITTAALLALAAPAFADEDGDAAKGEKDFKKCKACHMIASPDGENIVKGGKTGPNLYGIIGRIAGTQEGFKYGDGLQEAAAAEFVWTKEAVAAYIEDPKSWLGDQGFAEKSKMTFKMKKDQEDVAAFLAANSPMMDSSMMEMKDGEETKSSD